MGAERTALIKARIWFDLVVMALVFAMGSWMFYRASGADTVVSFESFLALRVSLGNLLLLACMLACWHLIFVSCGLYRSRRLATARHDARDIAVAVTLCTLLVFLAGKLFGISVVSLQFVGVFWLSGTTLLILSRLLMRLVLRHLRLAGRNLRHIVVVGTNSEARQYVAMLSSRPELGYHFLGYYDDSPGSGPEDSELPLVGQGQDFAGYLRNSVVDEIAVFIPLRSQYDKIARIVTAAEEQGVILRFPNNPFPLTVGRSVVDRVGDVTVTTVQTGSMYGSSLLGAKRLLDVFVSATALVLLAPLLLLVALVIRLDSPGAALFKQQRVGLNKRRFNIYKFRTMRSDAEQLMADLEEWNEAAGPVFKIKDDPRITWVGKFLRKTSIDELPQLLNVLIGQMSLVGPRPLPIRDYEGFNQDIHRRRFSVKPGITCLWQISGRSNVSFDEWMEMDMCYIDRWSFWLDLKILAKTIPAVLAGTGAE